MGETVRLESMNNAVLGLSGDIRQGSAYYEDMHNTVGKFDFVMASPPSNVERVEKDRLKDGSRFPFGLPRTDNADYLWIQVFYSELNDTARPGFVTANSASDTRGSELEIRCQLIESGAVEAMVAVGSDFSYTVSPPCTVWLLDESSNDLGDGVLFIDARHIDRQADRACMSSEPFGPREAEFQRDIGPSALNIREPSLREVCVSGRGSCT
jgi:type I restriction enzyme M protein